ncbi:MAG: Xaa-Pro peptidase family protein [Verrucomicrobia bacterium]|nr:Xaa-Pro peptidase family protein [Verrucomicrobiota bacterium]
MKKLTTPKLMLGGTADHSDVRYASGFTAPDPFLFLQHGIRRVLVVSMLEYGRAAQSTSRVKILTPADLHLRSRQRRRLGGWASGLLRKFDIKRVEVSPFFPVGIVRALEKENVRVDVSKASSMYPQRQKKSEKETACIKESQRAAVAAMSAAVDCIRNSRIGRDGFLYDGREKLTSERVRRVIEDVLLDRDCTANDTIVAGGVQGTDPHERGHGPLRACESIVIDIFPKSRQHGYWGDITRTVVRGEASRELKKMYNAVKGAHRAALSEVRAGVSCRTVHNAAADFLSKRGYETGLIDGSPQGFIHSTGHGVGLDIHEAPSVSWLDERLHAGNVITIEPGLYYRKTGAVRIEDTVVVTRDGFTFLARCPKKFEL